MPKAAERASEQCRDEHRIGDAILAEHRDCRAAQLRVVARPVAIRAELDGRYLAERAGRAAAGASNCGWEDDRVEFLATGVDDHVFDVAVPDVRAVACKDSQCNAPFNCEWLRAPACNTRHSHCLGRTTLPAAPGAQP